MLSLIKPRGPVIGSDKPSVDAPHALMPMRSPRVAMVAGEASGDLLASLLLGGMRARWPTLDSYGIGGPRMRQRGFDVQTSSDKLAVHGFGLDVWLRYREIVGIRRKLARSLLNAPPRLFIGIDAPDFNLDLEAGLRAAGIPTVHFVCPSIWAWRPGRIQKIKASADHVLCIFPFEPPLLAAQGIDATYVGHPLADIIPLDPDRLAARITLGIDADATVVALLPGSRVSEVKHLAPVFIAAAVLMASTDPTIHFVLPAVPALHAVLANAVAAGGMTGRIQLLEGRSHEALAACDVTLIASGTATLEAALFKRPMVIAYRMAAFSWRLMAPRRLQPWVGLPNILCEDFVVPEFLQDAATPEHLARAVLRWLASPDQIAQVRERFVALHHRLQRDTATLATDAIDNLLRKRSCA